MRVVTLCCFEVMLQEGNGKGYILISLTPNLVSRVTRRPVYKLLSKNTCVSVLSVCIAPSLSIFFTSSADAIITKHTLSADEESPIRQEPLMSIKTGHSGQQGLKVRSDEVTFATAGWDFRVRVYSTHSMRELAVLKWHPVGCYATAFAEINSAQKREVAEKNPGPEEIGRSAMAKPTGQLTRRSEQRRNDKAKSTHWLAAGSKDGKISLWDIC